MERVVVAVSSQRVNQQLTVKASQISQSAQPTQHDLVQLCSWESKQQNKRGSITITAASRVNCYNLNINATPATQRQPSNTVVSQSTPSQHQPPAVQPQQHKETAADSQAVNQQ